MNTLLLPCPSMKEHIFHIWNIIPRPLGVIGWITWWNNAISRTTKVLRTIGAKFAKRRRKSNLIIRTEFARASFSLEVDPFNITLQANVAALRHEIRKAKVYAAKGAQLKSRLKWLKVGDRVSKELFKRLRPPCILPNFKLYIMMVTESPISLILFKLLFSIMRRFLLPNLLLQLANKLLMIAAMSYLSSWILFKGSFVILL